LVVVVTASNLVHEGGPVHNRHHQVDEEDARTVHLTQAVERLLAVAG
jgi:hypothetical protein